MVLALAGCGDGDSARPSAAAEGASGGLRAASAGAGAIVPLDGGAPAPAIAVPPPATGPTPPHWPDSFSGLEHTRRPAGNSADTSPVTKALPSDGPYSIDTTNRELVRLFFRTVYASADGLASGWSGNPAACEAGDTSAAFKAASLRRINWFRAMAGVPATIQLDAVLNQRAQQAAMLMSANGQISHTPPSSWACYSATAADTAAKSNLGLGINGPDAIEGYVAEPGANNSMVGHRRWLLYPQTRFMGVGDVGTAPGTSPARTNALWVIDANALNTRPAVRDDFVAWPPRGYTPYQTVYPRWSFSYPRADFGAATVTMTENGQSIGTRKESVATGFGENTLVWFPGGYADGMRWAKPGADTVYQVTVANVLVDGRARSFSYAVTVFDPQSGPAGTAPLIDAGPAELDVNQAGAYTFTTLAGASFYQWRSLSVASYSLIDGAESGSAAFAISTSAGYNAIDSQAVASGTSAYHLAHTRATDQTLLLNQTLVGAATASLSFASRLGLSSAAQVAMVEVSTDESASWSVLWQQAGQQSGATTSFGEPGFTTRTVSLATLADRTFRLRFRYALNTSAGVYYPQAVTGVGWYVDDIRITGAQSVASASPAVDAQGAGFSLVPTAAGSLLLQVRAGLFGYYADWSPARRVSVQGAPAPVAALVGSDGDDLLRPGAGSHRIDGLAGLDTVSYA
ncbi:MAG: CAP domain-containing protein, partial [Burkholderiaceae bacterium]|nr:CAP domain-containing protein [Burkholderiaceae bacterium]